MAGFRISLFRCSFRNRIGSLYYRHDRVGLSFQFNLRSQRGRGIYRVLSCPVRAGAHRNHMAAAGKHFRIVRACKNIVLLHGLFQSNPVKTQDERSCLSGGDGLFQHLGAFRIISDPLCQPLLAKIAFEIGRRLLIQRKGCLMGIEMSEPLQTLQAFHPA